MRAISAFRSHDSVFAFPAILTEVYPVNRLANQKSLYLQQHANNPVDWYPWGDEAFAKARELNKPILVSIGYSSCHWCHVMAHESFEDSFIAGLMNQHFICIKVDREEHPDVDRTYMESVQMMNGQGGWPLNIFCLPDGRPFAGGTYFPPNDKAGYSMVPWPDLILRVSDYFKRKREDLEENAQAILGNLEATNQAPYATGDAVTPQQLFTALDHLLEAHDTDYGGFGEAPKFPPAMALDFLLALRQSASVEQRNPERAQQIDDVICTTLRAMAHGGIFDQIGGGFARYSVDRFWVIPHFEKMLYDNALLLNIYTKAWQRYRDPLYKAVIEETIDWLFREMSLEGAFASAIDADSKEGEGEFYVWTPEQIKEVLGDQAESFCEDYGISQNGNFENSGKSNPTLMVPEFDERQHWKDARAKLLQVRNQRVVPARDNKALIGWNALLIPALVDAGYLFQRNDWMQAAGDLATWIWKKGRYTDGSMGHVVYDNELHGSGLLTDYTYSAEAFLALASRSECLTPDSAETWIERAAFLMRSVFQNFHDDQASGYFLTPESYNHRVHRPKEWLDSATPSGNSAALHVLSQLAILRPEEPEWRAAYQQLAGSYGGMAERLPHGVGHALSALTQEAIGLASLKIPSGSTDAALHSAISDKPWRRLFILLSHREEYLLCVGTQCQAPENTAEEALVKF